MAFRACYQELKVLRGPYRCVLSRRLRRKWLRVHIAEIALAVSLLFALWVTFASAALVFNNAFLLGLS